MGRAELVRAELELSPAGRRECRRVAAFGRPGWLAVLVRVVLQATANVLPVQVGLEVGVEI